jgi:general secretion pathway protein D
LEDFLEGANELAQSGTGTGGRQQSSTTADKNDVVVVPDEVTNSLLIAANKTRYIEVVEMIELLDRRQDQVLIETALIELSGSDLYSMGVELGLASLPGIGEIGGFGVTSFGLSSFDDLDPIDGIPDTKVPNLGAGFTGGLLDGDDFSLPLLLSLAETNEDANVLNIPSVLVSNNSTATVSTEDEQPYTTVNALGSGNSTSDGFGGYEKAGITLKISPSISAARYLRLGIDLNISNFRAATLANSPPPRTTRILQTQVNVPDGDTMVIGGIISDNETKATSKIPVLGDLPLVGFLFRSKADTSNRTSLYFFVTPHILHDEDFADLGELSYRAKQEAAERIGYERIRMIDDEFSIDDELFSLEAFQLPRFRRPDSGEVDGDDVGIDPMRRNALLRAAAENKSEASEEADPEPAVELGTEQLN